MSLNDVRHHVLIYYAVMSFIYSQQSQLSGPASTQEQESGPESRVLYKPLAVQVKLNRVTSVTHSVARIR